ncbi:TetR/AcrR family transcriptional regulator [Scytonema hofmannii FACHB-248]|uniref:TetR/AcrR family transcriptional regulator n=1 Tax=Scytonema hofmannii FACHB-248 TaxID=1842502 RepID=A0ABR8GNU1_9CYAN|nr:MULTISPECIES: TetR/AcrR family transcriptional regulator [Nostocales]MBD2604611.1 TetR/AcrR family transcriptional regulator [Scytonema hofmannii FACHB-248]
MPKIVDHNQYRKELLSKCFDLFAEKGYGSITMRQIADGLRVSTGTLYHYFPSKQALFEQLMEEICQQDLLKATTELSGTQTLPEQLEIIGKFLIKEEDYLIKWTYLLVDFCQHQNAQGMQNIDAFNRINERYKQAIYEISGIQDPVIAAFIYSFIDGLIVERLFKNKMVSIPEQCTLLGKMLMAYLEKENMLNTGKL